MLHYVSLVMCLFAELASNILNRWDVFSQAMKMMLNEIACLRYDWQALRYIRYIHFPSPDSDDSDNTMPFPRSVKVSKNSSMSDAIVNECPVTLPFQAYKFFTVYSIVLLCALQGGGKERSPP